MNNQKQFGVWMDSHHATVVGKEVPESDSMIVISHIKGEDNTPNSNEKHSNNNEKTITGNFFKEIATHLVNATDIHVTGTGQVQEEFIHYLADSPQFKNARMEDSTSNKMSDEKLIEFITAKFS